MDIEEVFGKKKVIIGMVHFPPLPGSPLYDEKQDMKYIRERIKGDVKRLQNGGIDALMFCNENDRPYVFKANYSTISAMSETIGELSGEIKIPFGIDVLWDPNAALATAKATGAKFIREIMNGTYVSDMGLWNTNVGEVYRYRKLLNAENVAMFFNISAEFAYDLDQRPIEKIAKSVVFSSLADVILISGSMTGIAPTVKTIEKVKKVINVPVFVNTGLNADNADKLLRIADGAVVGTSLKVDGITWNPVDKNRVRQLMKVVEGLR